MNVEHSLLTMPLPTIIARKTGSDAQPHKRPHLDNNNTSSIASLPSASLNENKSQAEHAVKMNDGDDGHDVHEGHDSHEKEHVCGITEYVSPKSQGFSGILKKR